MFYLITSDNFDMSIYFREFARKYGAISDAVADTIDDDDVVADTNEDACDDLLEEDDDDVQNDDMRIYHVPPIKNLFPCTETRLYIVITSDKAFLKNLRNSGVKFDCHFQKKENVMGNYETLYKVYTNAQLTETFYKGYLDGSPEVISHFYVEDIGHTWTTCSSKSDSSFVLIETKNKPALQYTLKNCELIYMFKM